MANDYQWLPIQTNTPETGLRVSMAMGVIFKLVKESNQSSLPIF
jgi:hypothetical protein